MTRCLRATVIQPKTPLAKAIESATQTTIMRATHADTLLKRPECNLCDMAAILSIDAPRDVLLQADYDHRYAGYIKRQNVELPHEAHAGKAVARAF